MGPSKGTTFAEIAHPALVQSDLLAADLRRAKRGGWQLGVWLALVGHEVEVGIAKRRELLGIRAGAIEGDQDLLLGAEGFAQPLADRQKPLGEVIVRWDRYPKHRPPVLVVRVVVGRARVHALVLHPPALPHDVLAAVLPQVIVHVEDRRAVLARGGCDQPLGHARFEHHPAVGLREQTAKHLAHATSCRHALGAEQRRSRRRRESAHALDAHLPDRQRTDDRVESDSQPVGTSTLERALRLFVQTHLTCERE